MKELLLRRKRSEWRKISEIARRGFFARLGDLLSFWYRILCLGRRIFRLYRMTFFNSKINLTYLKINHDSNEFLFLRSALSQKQNMTRSATKAQFHCAFSQTTPNLTWRCSRKSLFSLFVLAKDAQGYAKKLS